MARGTAVRRQACGLLVVATLATAALLTSASAAAAATDSSSVVAAALQATQAGDRTGIAVLDLRTGVYRGAGEDTAPFPAESVAKVLIATELLATGQMDAATSPIAYRMITASDDAAADALYARAGGDSVARRVATRYRIDGLGSPPPVAGRWGLTPITARAVVQLYSALSRDPTVWPWLGAAMAHPAAVAADGTDQRFGLLAASGSAVIKQGWGHDGVGPHGAGAGNAVVLSTGIVDGGDEAVAVLTSGPPATFLGPLAATVTAQARWLPSAAVVAVAAAPTHPAVQPSWQRLPVAALGVAGLAVITTAGGVAGVRHLRGALRARGDRRERERLDRRLRRAEELWAAGEPVRLRLATGRAVSLRRSPQAATP